MNKLQIIKAIRDKQEYYKDSKTAHVVIGEIANMITNLFDDIESRIKEALKFDQDYEFSEFEKKAIIIALIKEFS